MDITLITAVGAITTIVQVIGTLIVVRIQKAQIEGLRANVSDQTAVINAIKSQADGQAAITARLEAIVDRTERHATTVLTNHEKLIKLVEDRAAREKQELEDRAEREKQEMNKMLEDARGQLLVREETIKDADIKPELASLLTSLNQESFATKELLTSLKTELLQLTLLTNNIASSIQPVAATLAESQTDNTNSFPSLTEEDKEYIKRSVMNAYLNRPPGYNVVINHLIWNMRAHFDQTKRPINDMYKEILRYAETLGLGPFSVTA